MYQVLYRKWRPKVFEDVIGQPQVTVTLRNELKSGRISHAYLFTGSRGTGKTTCAKILAKAVNCLSKIDGDPCGQCEICKGIDSGAILDILEIDAASNNGVDNIRALRDEASYTPTSCKYRVYIIDEVHMLSISAFNALLKTLEEPPAHVIFILATTELHKLPATILSRCQRFDFRRIAASEIANRLIYIAKEEGAVLEYSAALLIANLADGAMRDALSILDQCIGISNELSEEKVREIVGLSKDEYLFKISDAIFEKDPSKVLEAVDYLYNNAKDITRLCEDLASHLRSLMLIKTMKSAKDILSVSDENYALLENQAKKAPLSEVLKALDIMQETIDKIGRAGNKRTELEMALVRLCAKEVDVSNEALLRRIEALEKILEGGVPMAKPQPIKTEAPKEEPVKEEPKPEIKEEIEIPQFMQESEVTYAPKSEPVLKISENNEQIKETIEVLKEKPQVKAESASPEDLISGAEKMMQWPEVLQILKAYSQSIASAFNGSSAYISGDFVLIDAPNKIAFELLRKPTQRDRMRDAIRQVTGRAYRLGPYKKETENKEIKEDDALSKLLKAADDMGINVEIGG